MHCLQKSMGMASEWACLDVICIIPALTAKSQTLGSSIDYSNATELICTDLRSLGLYKIQYTSNHAHSQATDIHY